MIVIWVQNSNRYLNQLNTQNYLVHEKAYQELKASGFQGWGGETHSARMSEWELTIRELLLNPHFPKAPARLLEIGCGAGDIAIQFADKGYLVSGVEISSTAVDWAKQKTTNHPLAPQFFQGNVNHLIPFNDQQFDVLIDGNCLHCIIGEDRKKTFNEIHRVLVTNGIFYLSTMIGDPKREKAHFKFDPSTRCQIQNGIPYRYMAHENDLIAEVITAGFKIIEKKVSHNTWWDHLSCLAQKL